MILFGTHKMNLLGSDCANDVRPRGGSMWLNWEDPLDASTHVLSVPS